MAVPARVAIGNPNEMTSISQWGFLCCYRGGGATSGQSAFVPQLPPPPPPLLPLACLLLPLLLAMDALPCLTTVSDEGAFLFFCFYEETPRDDVYF